MLLQLLLWLLLPASYAWTRNNHKIIEESVLYDGKWRRMINRKVQMPSVTADFAVCQNVGTDKAVIVVAWNSTSRTCTMVEEYMPASDSFQYGHAAGMVEDKHGRRQATRVAAEHELEEECRLIGGKDWHLLASNVIMDKYTTTAITVYLVIDADTVLDSDAKPRDDTEQGMRVVPEVSYAQLKSLLKKGKMTVVGSWATLLALEKLRELNMPLE